MHRFAYYQSQRRGSSFKSSLGLWPSCQNHPAHSPIQHQAPAPAPLALTLTPTKVEAAVDIVNVNTWKERASLDHCQL